MNGFDVREDTFSAEVKSQSVVCHNVYLLNDTLWMYLNLNASEEVYDAYLRDFKP